MIFSSFLKSNTFIARFYVSNNCWSMWRWCTWNFKPEARNLASVVKISWIILAVTATEPASGPANGDVKANDWSVRVIEPVRRSGRRTSYRKRICSRFWPVNAVGSWYLCSSGWNGTVLPCSWPVHVVYRRIFILAGFVPAALSVLPKPVDWISPELSDARPRRW